MDWLVTKSVKPKELEALLKAMQTNLDELDRLELQIAALRQCEAIDAVRSELNLLKAGLN